MAKTKISEFSPTPANNTDIDNINIAEGCAPSGINDAIRELMAQLKDFQAGTAGDSFNGPIGATTAVTGAFTNVTASGTLGVTGVATLGNGAVLGTPASVTLTNGTGLPIATGVSGLGTGVATALAVNVGSAGAPVINGGALGTPSSGTVTNLTGTASININGTVGATTANTGAFTTLTTSGNVTLGDATSDTITANGRFNTDVVPSTDNARDLGTTALKWRQVYATAFTENGFGVVSQTDIGTAPNEIPLNQYLGDLAYMNAEAVVIQPQASVTPNGIGDMVFQLTSDTSLVIKVKGSDGTVRSVALTLA